MNESEHSALAHLAERAVAGDRHALDQLLRELRPRIVRTVRLVVGSGSWAAEDAAQEAMIDLMRGIRGLRNPAAVHGWALRLATTRAIKVARRERILSFIRPLSEQADLAATASDSSSVELKQAFDALPPRMRAVAVLRLYTGLSEHETAKALGCSVGTVKSQLHEARLRLATALRGEDQAQGTLPPQLHGPLGDK